MRSELPSACSKFLGDHWGLTASDAFGTNFTCLKNRNLARQGASLRSVRWKQMDYQARVSPEDLKNYIPPLLSRKTTMPCTKQKCRACIFMHLWCFWWSPPLSQENGVDSSPFSPLSWCPLPATLTSCRVSGLWRDRFPLIVPGEGWVFSKGLIRPEKSALLFPLLSSSSFFSFLRRLGDLLLPKSFLDLNGKQNMK